MKNIGRYEICGLLGKGGMSTVYQARMPVVGKVVALKLLSPHPHLVDQLGMVVLRERFTAEAVTMARLHHPHLAEVWDYDEFQGQPFFVMEYFCNNLGRLIGETYRLENPSRPLPIPQVIRYGRQILEGLACLHRADIIHRDIKPFNILLTDQDAVKISDFGMSKLRGEVWSGPPSLMVGSPYYAAPEQEENPGAADIRSDIYAVGVLLCRMITGRLPDDPPSPASPMDTRIPSAPSSQAQGAVPQPRGFTGLSPHTTTFDSLIKAGEPGTFNNSLSSGANAVETSSSVRAGIKPAPTSITVRCCRGGVHPRPLRSAETANSTALSAGAGRGERVVSPGLDPAWKAFFQKATAFHPAERFPDAHRMIAALNDLEQLWQEKVRTTCAAPPSTAAVAPQAPPPLARTAVRRQPLKVSPKLARDIFDLDELWRPRHFLAGGFAAPTNGTVTDHVTSLTWQQAGSDYPVTWREALDYVADINRRRFGDSDAWRLPTVAELLTLIMAAPGTGISCQPPIFDTTQGRLWSADRSSFTAAWCLNIDFGFVNRQDFTCRAHVRAVYA